MRLIASGRASEIFDLGDGRVLRRFKAGGDPAREALVMEHARSHGYPVPRVLDVTPDALVLERVTGPTMSRELRRRPWRLGRDAALLASLHERLHRVAAPDGLAGLGAGDRLLHLDLHPDNVILSARRPGRHRLDERAARRSGRRHRAHVDHPCDEWRPRRTTVPRPVPSPLRPGRARRCFAGGRGAAARRPERHAGRAPGRPQSAAGRDGLAARLVRHHVDFGDAEE